MRTILKDSSWEAAEQYMTEIQEGFAQGYIVGMGNSYLYWTKAESIPNNATDMYYTDVETFVTAVDNGISDKWYEKEQSEYWSMIL